MEYKILELLGRLGAEIDIRKAIIDLYRAGKLTREEYSYIVELMQKRRPK